MSGHNKWSNIKHKKGAIDAQRGKTFTKLIREIEVAARIGGGDPNSNPRLRAIISKARVANMPKDNIDKAIKKGTGEIQGETYEEIYYEGYGPAGVAIMIKTLTDNKNRTASAIRTTLSKYGGNLGENGCVGWMFKHKGVITLEKDKFSEDELANLALELNADDYSLKDDVWEIYVDPNEVEKIKEILEKKNISYISAESTMVPDNTVKLTENEAIRMLKMLDVLDENEDVQETYDNAEIDDAVVEKYEQMS
ncbi:MAG: YebC/PmpR family DNA-binding transcriptional regulator [Spirochaetes bacterium]|nr:YebC/PmpR family DNA-binding transcriptional regulator [Spirochaetota bacterium]NLJ04705.1 YebC/PmpR family DNA-binding transcriptional regulator [Exilispira sp.]MBP8990491.1 YebC/PmpR family DNA-binding transcriptional regulator [Spirochaetota bacterium]HOV45515.1 YebC/PmpR family DNA-binding transcriptional regulator [Exilispira sp.]HQJ41263.1 YebC/PmpR family DNA-binding transcriptional regulator [Exilispira sp.]